MTFNSNGCHRGFISSHLFTLLMSCLCRIPLMLVILILIKHIGDTIMKKTFILLFAGAIVTGFSIYAFSGPCRGGSWRPTFVHDLISPDGPYYVMPNGSFVKLQLRNGSWVNHACEMIGRYGVRNRRGYTNCQNYTRIQCGCDRRSTRSSGTCRAFMRFKGHRN